MFSFDFRECDEYEGDDEELDESAAANYNPDASKQDDLDMQGDDYEAALKLNTTKEAFEKSKYLQRKYGKLKYVSESGKIYKTSKGKVLKFKESIPAEFGIGPDPHDEGKTETLVKVNDLVSKAYANLYDELKKAGIDFDSASDDGFYVNDPDAQKTYFINLYVNECKEYEGSYRADES